MNRSTRLYEFSGTEKLQFELTIGIPPEVFDSYHLYQDLDDFMFAVYERVSSISGGLTHYKGTGIWRSDGNKDKHAYDGEMNMEEAYIFVVTLDPCSELLEPYYTVGDAFNLLKQRFQLAYKDKGKTLPIQWVNVEVQTVTTAHFDISGSE